MVCVGFERLSEFRDAVKTLFRKETSDMLQLLKEKLQNAVNGSTNVIQVEALLACGAVHANCLATEKWDPSWAGPIHALLTVQQDHGGPTRIAECAERHVNLLKKLGARFPGTILRETIDPYAVNTSHSSNAGRTSVLNFTLHQAANIRRRP
eukprot:m.311054 g.311054  ORF g.311054 m.311054 type:complete len:152 (-) comp16385_c0_seq45:988-1443(-)